MAEAAGSPGESHWKRNCPVCAKPVVYGADQHFPFCSQRCRSRDFFAWDSGARAIVTPLMDADADEPAQ